MDDIISTAKREPPFPQREAPGLSPGKASLLYGVGGFLLGGPLGALIGAAGAGITAKRNKDSYLDRLSRETANLNSEQQSLYSEIAGEIEQADPDEKRLLLNAKRVATDGYLRLQSGDQTGAQMIEQANAVIRGVIQGDVTARKTEQAAQFNDRRQIVGQAAQAYRNQYQGVVEQARQVDSLAERVFELTADPKFDPSKPVNRAILSQLITAGVGDTFRDDPSGFLAGLSEAGQGTIVGGIAKGLDTFLDAEDFKVTREDFNRLALNSRKIVGQYAEQRIGELRQQASSLNKFSQQAGLTDPDYDLADYISGGSKDLKIAPAITSYRRSQSSTPTTGSTGTSLQQQGVTATPGSSQEARQELELAQRALSERKAKRRPTN